MPTPLNELGILRQANQNLRSALVRLRPEQTHCSTITPVHLTGLLDEIKRAAECLRRQPVKSEDCALMESETREFVRNLEQLQHRLPELHRNLLAERSRLETAQTHVVAAAAWAQANKKSL